MTEMPNRNGAEAEVPLTAAAHAALEESVERYRRYVLREAAAQAGRQMSDAITAANIAALSQRESYVDDAAKVLFFGAMQDRRDAERVRVMASLLLIATVISAIAAGVLVFLSLRNDGSRTPDIVSLTSVITAALASAGAYAISLISFRRSREASHRARDAEYVADLLVSTRLTGGSESPPDESALTNAKYLREWQTLERLVNQLGDRRAGAEQGRPRSLGSTLATLSESKAMSPELVSDIKKLLRIRNEIVHGRDDSRFVSASPSDLDQLSRTIESATALFEEASH
jgi:hypothetical protein